MWATILDGARLNKKRAADRGRGQRRAYGMPLVEFYQGIALAATETQPTSDFVHYVRLHLSLGCSLCIPNRDSFICVCPNKASTS